MTIEDRERYVPEPPAGFDDDFFGDEWDEDDYTDECDEDEDTWY